MNWKSQDIIDSFNGVIKDAKYMSTKDLDNKYSDFRKSFEKLYQVAIDSVVSGNVQEASNMLNLMINANGKIFS